jgi:hypothetical protein
MRRPPRGPLLALHLTRRKAPLTVDLYGSEISIDLKCAEILRMVERARPFIAIWQGHFTSPEPALLRIAQYDLAWTAAAVALSFVRANRTHPFALSILPLIPTIVALTESLDDDDGAYAKDPNPAKRFLRLSTPCGTLLQSAFGRAHTGLLPPPVPSTAADDDVSMTDAAALPAAPPGGGARGDHKRRRNDPQ